MCPRRLRRARVCERERDGMLLHVYGRPVPASRPSPSLQAGIPYFIHTVSLVTLYISLYFSLFLHLCLSWSTLLSLSIIRKDFMKALLLIKQMILITLVHATTTTISSTYKQEYYHILLSECLHTELQCYCALTHMLIQKISC